MRRISALVLVGLLFQNGLVADDITFRNGAPTQKQDTGDPNELQDFFQVQVDTTGDTYAPWQGPHNGGTKPHTPRPTPPTNPPMKPYDPKPPIIKPTTQPSQPQNPRSLIVPFLDLVAWGPETQPGSGAYLESLPADFIIDSAKLVTEFGTEFPYSITEVSDLSLLPTVIQIPNQGPAYITWDLSYFTETTGHFYLLEADIPLGDLFIPEPGSLALVGCLAAAFFGRRLVRR